MPSEISAKYNPSEVEDKWYKYWMKHDLFHSEPDEREPYTIVMPPPNVTGVLHMGHMLNNTIQDILVRRARMTGKNACWVPGTDHASIATEAKVVNRLAEQGIHKHDLTREEFLKHAWDWTHEHGGIIIEQLKKIGASADWDRTAFTMDDDRSKSVIKAFCDLYQKGLIYRGLRMVNWDPKALTALSDEEVIHKDEHSKLYYLRYNVVPETTAEEYRYIIIATTRPETIFGDTAVCIHPEDERYKWLHGRRVVVPVVNREIPIICDDYVDREFGTGCLKVTPSHDINDYMLGEKYNLPAIDIFNPDGSLNEHGLHYKGKDRFVVRDEIIEEIKANDLLEKVEDYDNSVGFSERSNVPIEPKLSTQWFLRMTELSKPAYDAVMNDEIALVPAKFKNTYSHWMENIKDWCISRQLWWGHRIPAYYSEDGEVYVAETLEAALDQARERTGNNALTADALHQDEDSLDTWFSSWLWPMSVFTDDVTAKEANKDLSYYYPTDDLVSGPDILFFWVARMIMAGYEYRGDKPFKHVYLTGIVRDELGRKMSKSLGNSPDPLKLIEKYGADGVRMGLMSAASAGNDILFDEGLCEQGRNFNNKIWNSYRLITQWPVDEGANDDPAAVAAVRWFDALLGLMKNSIEDDLSKYRISDAMVRLYKFVRDDFSGTYLELVKPAYGKPIDSKTLEATKHFFEEVLLLLHPFMPFITEELWQAIASRKDGESIMTAQISKPVTVDDRVIEEMEVARQVISSVRNLRASVNLSPKEALTLIIKDDALSADAEAAVRKLANINNVKKQAGPHEESDASGEMATFMVGTHTFSVPLEGYINVEEEVKKLEDEKAYYHKFLATVRGKLSNENFVSRAPEKVVALERKKEADALEKLESIEKRLQQLLNN